MINAIQALEGLLGPTGSKASYHAIDFYRRFHYLSRSRERRKQDQKHEEKGKT